VILSWIGYELGCLSHVTKYMVYIKIEMSMIKYYHEYILFKCYYSFKMVLGIFYCCLSEEVGVDVELLIHFFLYFDWCIGLLLVILHNPVLCHLFH
jgi:hypothetical protein